MSSMIQREIVPAFKKLVADYPVVTVLGPRQSGKTTLVKSVLDGYGYVNLEDAATADFARNDYKGFLRQNPPPLIIDEIQRVPEITSALQVAVDKDRQRRGQYILTGSHQPLLMQSVSQSLAGRTALIELMPLTVAEVRSVRPDASTDELMLRGFMPEVASTSLDPTTYYRNYFQTYVERDVRMMVNVRDRLAFDRFVTLLAGRVGQLLNLTALAGEVGVSAATLANWLSVLEASFIVFRLPPYFANVSKRIVKTPKFYFTDVGLASMLLGIENVVQMARDPLRGNLFENMVVADLRKQRLNMGRDAGLFMLRTEKGFEIDVISKVGRRLRPIEIKSAATCRPEFANNLLRFSETQPESISPTVIYDGDGMAFSNGLSAVNFRDFHVDA